MEVREALDHLWRERYFEEYRKTSEIRTELRTRFGVTHANLNVALKRIEFLRKTKEGWIQKKRAEGGNGINQTPDYFTLLDIHPEIKKVSQSLYEHEHYAEAIRAAYIQLVYLVKQKSGRADLDGKPLMLKIFSPNNPVLKFNDLKNQIDLDEQEGMMHIYAGVAQGIRNPKAHFNIVQKDPVRTMEYLVLASLLCKRLNETKK